MSYRDFKNIKSEDFIPIAIIPNFMKKPRPTDETMYITDKYTSLYIYKFIFDDAGDKAVCSLGKSGIKELYNIETINNIDYLRYQDKDGNKRKVSLEDNYFLYGIIGKIEDNKIYSSYFRQGYIYKNEIAVLRTINLTDEEIDKLPLEEKICYIPEACFEKDPISLSSDLIDGKDYYTVKSIREDIENYFGHETMNKLSSADIKFMIMDVFDALDWQFPSSLIEGDEYLDSTVNDNLNVILNMENRNSINTTKNNLEPLKKDENEYEL